MPHRTHYLKQELYAQLQADSAIFDFLQEGVLDGVWYWDLEHPEHEWMSERFWRVLGYDPAEMPHSPSSWQDIINPEDLETALENFNRHCADPAHHYDQIVRYRHQEGHDVSIRCRGFAIRDKAGRPIRMLGTHSDITHVIDARIAEERRSRAESANRTKSVFLANVSHEIRTPLGSLLATAEALRATKLTAQQAEMLDDLLLAGEQLQSLLVDLIDISRIEAGEVSLEFEPFAPRDLLEDVAATFISAAKAKNLGLAIQMAVGSAPVIVGATKRIRQVLINLMSNAIKFTDTGQITLSCETTPAGDAEEIILILKVTDTGPGVPDDVKDMIFDRHHRSDTDNDLFIPGVGIGLSISKTLCALHGGGLSVEDARGGGAVFTARFQARIADEPSVMTPEPDAPDVADLPSGLRVLVAEDVFLNRRSLSHLLALSDIDLVFATTGRDALEMLRQREFDVALIDLRMPGMNGLEVVKRYRTLEASQQRRRLRIFACSAHVLKGEKADYRTVGFDGFLAKPFKLRELVAALTV